VREGAILEILAGLSIGLEVAGAELGLVLIWVIELFYSIVGTLARVSTITARTLACHLRADFRLVCAERPSAVFIIIMIKWAALQIMILRILLAWVYLESEEVEEHGGLLHADVPGVKASTVGILQVWASSVTLLGPLI
jgi:hypothetical protein